MLADPAIDDPNSGDDQEQPAQTWLTEVLAKPNRGQQIDSSFVSTLAQLVHLTAANYTSREQIWTWIVEVQTRIQKLGAPSVDTGAQRGVFLLVDDREHALVEFFRPQPWVRVCTLPTCDFLFVDEAGRPLLGFERKTQADLSQSVRHDQRYHDQKRRMRELGAKKLLVVLEGKALTSRMFELNCEANSTIRDGIGFTHTTHLLDTVLLVYRYALSVMEHRRELDDPSPIAAPYETFQGLSKKNDGLNFIRMIGSVPGFSGAKAKAVAAEFCSLDQLVREFSLERVANILYEAKAGSKLRRVGTESARKLEQCIGAQCEYERPPSVQTKKRKKSTAKSTAKRVPNVTSC